MKHTIARLLLAATIAAPTIADAQTSRSQIGQSLLERYITQRDQGQRCHAEAAKTAAADARLVSVTELSYSGSSFGITDSFALSYTGSHGGFFDERNLMWTWEFDQILGYAFSGGAYGPADTRLTQTFNTAGDIATTTIEFYTAPAWENVVKFVKTYDGTGRLSIDLQQSWNSLTMAWEDDYRTTYTYTTTGKIATLTREQWDGATWTGDTRATNTWDAAGNQITELNESYSAGGGWQNASKHTFTYDGAGNRTEDLLEVWSSVSPAWSVWQKTVYSGFVAHQPQTAVQMSWNSTTSTFENSRRENYTYNAEAKPEYFYDQVWDISTSPAAWGFDGSCNANRYHYEAYTGVNETGLNTARADIFPVPATNFLTIDVQWAATQPFTATITDMMGRMHKTWTNKPSQHYRETIDVAALPAGNYILTLEGKQGKICRSFAISR